VTPFMLKVADAVSDEGDWPIFYKCMLFLWCVGGTVGCHCSFFKTIDMEERMKNVVLLCTEAETATHIRLALIQEDVKQLFHRLLGELCDGVNPTSINARIWEGAEGSFVEACLKAQSTAWPDPKCRLSISENSVGILDNCREYDGLIAKGALERTLRGLIDLETFILEGSPASSSGALESYGLFVPRLMKKSKAAWGRTSAAALATLTSALRRPDLQPDGRRAALELASALAMDAPDDHVSRELNDVFFAELKANLAAANPYLRLHEAYAKLRKQEDVLRAMDAIRNHRQAEEKQRATQKAEWLRKFSDAEALETSVETTSKESDEFSDVFPETSTAAPA